MIFQDATGQSFDNQKVYRRLVSLFPSQTHLLHSLGLDEQVLGITRFCKYPSGWKKQKTVVGGTKDPKIERILALNPDLILANKEENTREAVETLRRDVPVYVSEVVSWEDNLRWVEHIGLLTGRQQQARTLIRQLETRQRNFRPPSGPVDALYLIWRNPWMAAGQNTFINTMLRLAGFNNVVTQERYPVLDARQMQVLNPQVVLLSSEPFPFKAPHADELRAILPQARFLFVQGEPFTWMGSYPLQSFDYFAKLHENLT